MDPQIVSAIIGAVGGIGAALVGKASLESYKSASFRRRHAIPDIRNTKWTCQWFFGDKELYVEDTVEMQRWTSRGSFRAIGYQSGLTYSIEGTIDPSRTVMLTYLAGKYPTEGFVGTACMTLSVKGDAMDGWWCGQVADGIRGGRVSCRRK